MEKIESNKLVAEFMGYKEHNHGSYKTFEKDGRHIYDNVLQYDTSWDWLMPVVEKIESLGHPAYITTFSVSINRDKKTDIHVPHNLLGETKLESTYKAVVEFIQWYNKNKA